MERLLGNLLIVFYLKSTILAQAEAPNPKEELQYQQVYYELSSQQSPAYACDYSTSLSSIELNESGMPCSSMYVNSTTLNYFRTTFIALVIENIRSLKLVSGKRCYKLKLSTFCEQRWFLPNLITRSFTALPVTKEECYSSNACFNCEVSSQYPQEDCEVFTFGKSEKSTEKTFAQNVQVYQSVVGESSYLGLNTQDNYISLGGDYDEKVFFPLAPPAEAKNMSFLVNPNTYSLLSYDMRRLLTFDNRTIDYGGKLWYLYEGNHLVLKEQIDTAVANQSVVEASPSSYIRSNEDLPIQQLTSPTRSIKSTSLVPSSTSLNGT